MTKFTLSTYLMVSVLIILSGILWILFTQVDRSYQYPVFSPDLQKEHSEIIERVYQLKPEIKKEVVAITPEIKAQPIEEIVSIAPVTSQQIQQIQQIQPVEPSASLAQENNYNDLWSTFPSSEYESYYYLRNNPWSPDYKSGH